MERKSSNNIYDGPQKGLFGETDRENGEYLFRSGDVEQIYSNAHYVPVEKSTEPPRYYKPEHQDQARRKKNGAGFLVVLCLCLCCALLGGIIGALLMSSYFGDRVSDIESNLGIVSERMDPDPTRNSPINEFGAIESTELSEEKAIADDLSAADEYKTYIPGTVMSAAEIYDMACTQSVVVNVEYVYSGANGIDIPSVTSGSGFIFDSEGYIITNLHVVEMAIKQGCYVNVMFADKTSYPARVVGYDEKEDVAVLKIDASGLNPVSFGDSSLLNVGDLIYAVGDPYGVLEFTMTTGNVCALDRLVATTPYENGIKMFQIDASVYTGNSGGPVYNEYGQVVGIVTAKYGEGEMTGIGFAVPINDALCSVNDIISTGFSVISKGVSMGITFDDSFTDVYSRYYNLPKGAFVLDVDRGSCSEKSGIRPGDILIDIDGHSLDNSVDVKSLMKEYYPGDKVEIILFRQGQLYSTNLTFDGVGQ